MNFNQTLQTKFPHLEVSCLKLSEVQKDNETKRIDSEYFKKEYLENEEILKNLNTKCENLGNLTIKMTGGATPLGADYPANGIPFLRVQNIMQNYFNLTDMAYITPQDDGILKRSRLKLNDVLLTITGISYGKSAVVTKDLIGANINQHSVKMEVRDINPYFLSTFLNSKFGKLQSDRKITGVTRPALDYQIIKTFLIPLLPMDFQLEIEKLVKDSHFALEQSKKLYKEAQNMLYTQLGLNPDNPLQSILDFHPTPKEQDSTPTQKPFKSNLNISIRTLKESLGTSGRLDSEYYQEKYYTMENLIKSKGFKTLEQICSLINYGSVPTSPYSENNERIPYIKGLNLKNLQIDEDKLDRITNAENLDSKFFTKENDIVISQMGTVGDVGIVSKKQENYIFASFTIRIRLKNTSEFNPYFVGLYIQHIAKEWYLYRNIAQASVRQNTDLPTIKNLYIPLIDTKTQEEIATLIQESFALRAKAKALLEEAKARVENAIKGV